MTQTWMNLRFATIRPSDFEDKVHFHCMANLAPQPAFAGMWTVHRRGETDFSPMSPIPHVKEKRAIILFANPTDQLQVAALKEFVQGMDATGTDAPPMFWAAHTVAPEVRPHNAVIEPTPRDGQSLVTGLMEVGIDGIISGEPAGFALALAIRMQVHKAEIAANTMTEAVYERRRRAQDFNFLKEYQECALWDYLRNRLAPTIPPCDASLGSGELRNLDGWTFGSCRQTACGEVYRLNRRRQDGNALGATGSSGSRCRESAKMVTKANIRGMSSIMGLKRMIDVMWTVSCEKWQHPNVIRLKEVYHSPAHIILRMEYGGAGSLYARLCRRSKSGSSQRPLSFAKTSQMMQQVVRAVTHLHLGPKVCHRDIKPENFDLHEALDTVTLKLTGFELAIVQEDPNSLCRCACGSVPFAAPEVLLQPSYNAMTADIWSTGITLFEILCGPRTLEKALGLQPEESAQARPNKGGGRPDEAVAKKLVEGFQLKGYAGRLMQSHCLRDAEPFLLSIRPMVDGMLSVNPQDRWSAIDVKLAAEYIPKGNPAQPPATPQPELAIEQHPSTDEDDKKSEDGNQDMEDPPSPLTNCCEPRAESGEIEGDVDGEQTFFLAEGSP
ncbi:unnamed protein product [Polarella glacialis]|uniref:Protein kinase domain-containing protein n=1 Tax=Polarella glacialis TaxID=89957 RepID=A0A813EI70_POLGL|nr:unnamed protein product [Polarella glacialis]